MQEIESAGSRNFLGLSEAYSEQARSYFHIIPVPYDATSSVLAGSRGGPKAIIDASVNVEIYDHDLGIEPARLGVATHKELPVCLGDPSLMVGRVEDYADGVVSAGGLPIILGGEHTVSLGAVRALARRGKFAVVVLDAHADLKDEYQGTAYSHACFLRRAHELTECCAFGVRSMSADEARYAKEAGIRMVFAEVMVREGIDKIDLDFLPREIYLSIDLDALDPSIMPATGAPEPGGLGWYDVVGLLRRAIEGRRVLGLDVVELCPQPGNPAPDFTAAKLTYKVMGLICKFSDNRREDWVCYAEEERETEGSG